MKIYVMVRLVYFYAINQCPGEVVETAMLKFATKIYSGSHDLRCLFFIICSCENSVRSDMFEIKEINII